MKQRLLVLSMLCALLFGATGIASAIPVFQDDFNFENGGVGALNYDGFANWDVTNGTVDLIGNGFYDFLPGNGLYVDLDGSTGDAGIMISKEINILDPGAYILSFDLAGSQRGSSELVSLVVAAGDFSRLISIDSSQGFTTYENVFYADAPGLIPIQIRFANGGQPGDNYGALLDNVSVTAAAAPVPEPGTILLLGGGLAGLVIYGRKRKNS